jgi:hypothetical protein
MIPIITTQMAMEKAIETTGWAHDKNLQGAEFIGMAAEKYRQCRYTLPWKANPRMETALPRGGAESAEKSYSLLVLRALRASARIFPF